MAVAPKNIFEIKKKYIGSQDAFDYSSYVPEETRLNVEKDKWTLTTRNSDIVLKGEHIYNPNSYRVSYKIRPHPFTANNDKSWSFFVIKSISLPEGYNVNDYSYDLMIDGQRIDRIDGFMTEILQDYVFDMNRQEIPFGILASVNGIPWFSRHSVQLEICGDKSKPEFLYIDTYKLVQCPKEHIEYPIFQTQYPGQENLEYCEKSNSYITRLNFNHITYYLFAKMDESLLSLLSRVELHICPIEEKNERSPDILEFSITYLNNNTIMLPLTPNIRNDCLDKYGLNLSRCIYPELHFFFSEQSSKQGEKDCIVDIYGVNIHLARANSYMFGLAFSK